MSRYYDYYYDAVPIPAPPPSTAATEDIIQGDIVAVNVRGQGRREGVVIGSHHDASGRHIIEIQFEPGDYYHAWQPHVTRVRRVTHYRHAQPPTKTRTVERYVYW